jgi:hypothetical protein
MQQQRLLQSQQQQSNSNNKKDKNDKNKNNNNKKGGGDAVQDRILNEWSSASGDRTSRPTGATATVTSTSSSTSTSGGGSGFGGGSIVPSQKMAKSQDDEAQVQTYTQYILTKKNNNFV